MKYSLPKEWFRHPANPWWGPESARARHIREQSEARFNARPDAEPIVLIRGELGTVQGFVFITSKAPK